MSLITSSLKYFPHFYRGKISLVTFCKNSLWKYHSSFRPLWGKSLFKNIKQKIVQNTVIFMGLVYVNASTPFVCSNYLNETSQAIHKIINKLVMWYNIIGRHFFLYFFHSFSITHLHLDLFESRSTMIRLSYWVAIFAKKLFVTYPLLLVFWYGSAYMRYLLLKDIYMWFITQFWNALEPILCIYTKNQ